MNDAHRRKELSHFLKTRRARISPVQVGLPPGQRRRTPGLRREEVAQLAGVSTNWYTLLEQGRDIQMSPQALESIARALKLDPSERMHFLTLARRQPPVYPSSPQETVSPRLQQTLDQMSINPAYITGPRWDLLAWNQAACSVFGDFGAMSLQQRNMLRLVFTDSALRQRLVDWESHAQQLLAQFRVSCSRRVGDPEFCELIKDLKSSSVEFRQWWFRHDVQGRNEGCKEIEHPVVGQLLLDYIVLQVADASELSVVLYLPLPGSDTERKLQLLAHQKI